MPASSRPWLEIADIAARAGNRPIQDQLTQLRNAVGEVAEAIGTTAGRFEAALGSDHA